MTDYYQKHYKAYCQKTFSIDPSSFLEPLRKHLEPGCTILDIGCGSGRDMLWLKNHGFSVSGFERSAGLAALARQNTGSNVIEGDFETFDFTDLPSDAVLFAGSLVHVPHEKLPQVFEQAIAGLRPGGKVLLSLKQGNGTGTDELDRVFYYWQESDLEALFQQFGLSILEFSRQVSKVNARDIWLGYVLEKTNIQHPTSNIESRTPC
ncbi:MAG: class I SAM-dependent methyltransferase [Thermodesulfobacteriota bacterium]